MIKSINKKRLKILLVLIVIVVAALPFGIVKYIYHNNYMRVETIRPWDRSISEFRGLKAEKYSFGSDDGQKLAGYRYYRKGLKPKAVVILAHGLGIGGQRAYMDTASCLTQHGFMVFGFDCTGVDGSEGDSMVGTQQGVKDLSHAIDFVEQNKTMKKYPIVLFGHSWGAYCAGAVLHYHPEVKAVAAVSGFDTPMDYMRGILQKDHLGLLSWYFVPAVKFEEWRDSKGAKEYSASEGFAGTRADIMIVHSSDDQNVSLSSGFDIYYSKFKNNSRFRFKLYKDRGHLLIFYTDAARAYDEKYISGSNGALTKYGKSHSFDRRRGFATDKKFYSGIIDFYNDALSH